MSVNLLSIDAASDLMLNTRDEEIITALQKGHLTPQGEFLWGSNYTFSVLVDYQDSTLRAVYKPTRGERPLWDFPRSSLARREVAAYLVSVALGWKLVPPTAYRENGPIGPGSVQLFVEHNPEYNYFNLTESDHQRLRPVALFDLVINNADRKGSHILFDPQGHIWLIDHGVCFHRDEKLRTVIWDFAGEPIPEDLCDDLNRFLQMLHTGSELVFDIQSQLNPDEINSLKYRIERLLASGRFPDPQPNRRPYPWPPI